jgi:two-component system chemotaxis response regulator CheY
MTILIVDDNARVRRMIAEMVGPLGSEVIECADGAQAVEMYQAHRPSVVLMDVAMRGLDGIAATTRIVHTHSGARIVIVTDYDEPELRAAAATAGACAYVLKENLLELRGVLEDVMRHDAADVRTVRGGDHELRQGRSSRP